MKPGFKQTKAGPIPDEWSVLPLGNHFTFKNGLNKAKGFFGYGTPIVNYMDVYNKRGISADSLQGRVSLSAHERSAYEVRKGDVFFTRTSETVNEVGISAVMLDEPKDTVFSGFVLRARPKDDRLDDRFKQYCFSSCCVRIQITSQSTETTRALTNGRALSAVDIPLPPKPEQRAIAEALGDADALIESLERLIAKKRDVKQGAMQELLAGRRRLPGFTDPWKSKKLSDLLRYERPDKYIVHSDVYTEHGNIPVLTANKSFVLGFTDEDYGVFQSPPAIIFDDFTTDSKYVDFSFKVKSSAIKLLHAKCDEVCLRFVSELMHLLKYPIGEHKRYYISEYQHLIMPMPSPSEQTAIAAVLSDMDAEIAALEAKLAKARAIKQGMMQELLTGRIRLK